MYVVLRSHFEDNVVKNDQKVGSLLLLSKKSNSVLSLSKYAASMFSRGSMLEIVIDEMGHSRKMIKNYGHYASLLCVGRKSFHS